MVNDGRPRCGPEHERLEVFVGTWMGEGELAGSGGRMVIYETFEWVPGRFFLTHRFDRRSAGRDRHTGVGIVEADASGGAYRIHLVDNLGFSRVYGVTASGDVWTFSGATERATYTFADGGRTMRAQWERSDDGETWVPLCEFATTKME